MLEENQLKIIKKIRENSRKSLSLISREINIKVPEMYVILNNLYEKGFIRKFTSILNHSNMGFGFNVLFTIKTDSHEKFKNYVENNQNINNASLVSESSAILECFFKTFTDIEKYKEELECLDFIKSFSEHHVLESIKHEEFLS